MYDAQPRAGHPEGQKRPCRHHERRSWCHPLPNLASRTFMHAKIEALNRTYFDFSAISSGVDAKRTGQKSMAPYAAGETAFSLMVLMTVTKAIC